MNIITKNIRAPRIDNLLCAYMESSLTAIIIITVPRRMTIMDTRGTFNTNPNTTIGVEISSDTAYIYSQNYAGVSGLPYGTQGNVAADVRNENDALAAWLMMRRGCTLNMTGSEKYIEPLSYYSNPQLGLQPSFKDAIANSKALAVVCSQRLGNLDFKLEQKYRLPVYRPLIGFNQEQIDAFKALMRQF